VALSFRRLEDHPELWAAELGIPREAIELYRGCEVVDLHLDSFIWTRVFGYDLTRRHGLGAFGGRFYSQVDLPRVREARITGGIWVITTNPARGKAGRARAFGENVARLRAILESCTDDVSVVRNIREYQQARRLGRHAAFLGIQGGNALDRDQTALDLIPDDLIIKITLVHLSSSSLGTTSSPLAGRRGQDGLTAFGKEYVRRLNQRRIFVDLAHVSRKGFYDAVEIHDRSQPLLVSHTGVSGVRPHWRNVDDEQIRAVADTGGVVAVMYQSSFLGPSLLNGRPEWVVDHLEHIAKVAGEDVPALGSDWDGAIIPPAGLRSCLELPRLVAIMLQRRWSERRIRKTLGENYLRALAALRP
jgi:membrane dipeptidase